MTERTCLGWCKRALKKGRFPYIKNGVPHCPTCKISFTTWDVPCFCCRGPLIQFGGLPIEGKLN